MAGSSAQFDEVLQAPEPEEPPLPIELTGPQYVRTLPGASAPFPYFDPLQISSRVCLSYLFRWLTEDTHPSAGAYVPLGYRNRAGLAVCRINKALVE